MKKKPVVNAGAEAKPSSSSSSYSQWWLFNWVFHANWRPEEKAANLFVQSQKAKAENEGWTSWQLQPKAVAKKCSQKLLPKAEAKNWSCSCSWNWLWSYLNLRQEEAFCDETVCCYSVVVPHTHTHTWLHSMSATQQFAIVALAAIWLWHLPASSCCRASNEFSSCATLELQQSPRGPKAAMR